MRTNRSTESMFSNGLTIKALCDTAGTHTVECDTPIGKVLVSKYVPHWIP